MLGREDVGPAGEVLLDDVVLRRARELVGDLRRRNARVLLLGRHLIHREQPHGRRVDRHRGVHLGEGDVLEELAHLAQVRDRYADLADLAATQRAVRVVAGLGGQVERHAEAGLSLGEVRAIERVGRLGGGVAGVGAHHPGLVPLDRDASRSCRQGRARVTHASPSGHVTNHAVGSDPLDLDGVGETSQVGHPAYGGAGVAHREVVAGQIGVAGGDGQQAEGRGVDREDAGHVHDDVVVIALEPFVDGVANGRRAAHVEVAVQYQGVAVRDDVHLVLLTDVPGRRAVTESLL